MLTLLAIMVSELAAITVVVTLAWLIHRMVLRYLGDNHRRPH